MDYMYSKLLKYIFDIKLKCGLINLNDIEKIVINDGISLFTKDKEYNIKYCDQSLYLSKCKNIIFLDINCKIDIKGIYNNIKSLDILYLSDIDNYDIFPNLEYIRLEDYNIEYDISKISKLNRIYINSIKAGLIEYCLENLSKSSVNFVYINSYYLDDIDYCVRYFMDENPLKNRFDKLVLIDCKKFYCRN
jgi:hypothetical protein